MLINYLLNNIESNPKNTFYVYNEKNISYEDFSYSLYDKAASLKNFGVNNREIVGIYLDTSVDILEIFFSCLLIGSIPIILPYNMTEHEIQGLSKQIKFSLIISSWKKLKNINFYKTTTCPIEELSHTSSGCSIKEIGESLDKNETQVMLLTSGTTGLPKIVELTANNFIYSAKAWNKIINFKKTDFYLCSLPLSHIGGLSIIIRSLIYQFRISLIDTFDNAEIINQLDNGINLISLVPSMMHELIEYKDKFQYIKKLKAIIMSGAHAHEKILDIIIKNNFPVYKSYGMTETTSGICGIWLNKNISKKYSVGEKHSNVEMKIHKGLLYVKSPMVMKGYYGNTNDEEWFNTKDKAEFDNDNFLSIKLQTSNKIISGGKNIDPIEIENVLSNHPKVSNAKVKGIIDDKWGQKVVAYIESSNLRKKDLLLWARKYLSKHKIPRDIFIKRKRLH